jgi:hypothetical protein
MKELLRRFREWSTRSPYAPAETIVNLKITVGVAEPPPSEPFKECRFCFEQVRARATRCRWCMGAC